MEDHEEEFVMQHDFDEDSDYLLEQQDLSDFAHDFFGNMEPMDGEFWE